MNGGYGPVLVVATLLALLASAVPGTLSAAPLDARMVAEQIEKRGIEDVRVLDALRRVPRAAFVPSHVRWRAHDDMPLPIGYEQTISQPYVVALMTALLDVEPGQKVLEIGTGSGYQAAVLSHLAAQVYTVEIIPELAAAARLRLTRQGFRNIHVRLGDGNFGWEQYGPYDRVIVTAAAAQVPEALVEQLVEGGVLVMPLGLPDAVQNLVRGVKRGGKLHARPIRKIRFVPLTGDVGGASRTREGRDGARGDVSAPREIDRRAPRVGRDRAAREPAFRGTDRRVGCDAAAPGDVRCARGAG